VTVHAVDEIVGLADTGREVAADVAGENLIEQLVLGGAYVVPAAVALLCQCPQQARCPDTHAVQCGGEELNVVVGL
jgi:hypothetical protein